MIRAGVGEVELLRYHRAPAVEKIRSDRNHQTSGAEIEPRPRDAVALTIRGDCRVIGAGIVAQMSGHSESGEPRVQKTGKASRFVLIDEYRAAGSTASRFAEFLREEL